jgi:hypothetical protein
MDRVAWHRGTLFLMKPRRNVVAMAGVLIGAPAFLADTIRRRVIVEAEEA